jgi:hypothetical protein
MTAPESYARAVWAIETPIQKYPNALSRFFWAESAGKKVNEALFACCNPSAQARPAPCTSRKSLNTSPCVGLPRLLSMPLRG